MGNSLLLHTKKSYFKTFLVCVVLVLFSTDKGLFELSGTPPSPPLTEGSGGTHFRLFIIFNVYHQFVNEPIK